MRRVLDALSDDLFEARAQEPEHLRAARALAARCAARPSANAHQARARAHKICGHLVALTDKKGVPQ